MDNHEAGMDFIEGFALFAAALWIIGALLVGTLAMLGNGRFASATPAANQTPVAESTTTQ